MGPTVVVAVVVDFKLVQCHRDGIVVDEITYY
jgi:hypothetical protein